MKQKMDPDNPLCPDIPGHGFLVIIFQKTSVLHWKCTANEIQNISYQSMRSKNQALHDSKMNRL